MKLSGPSPWVIAHRGASRDRPENSLAAFDEALRQGCDAIELDVQLTRDGVPVVWHDRTVVGAGGGRSKIKQLNVAELVGLDGAARWRSRQGSQGSSGRHIRQPIQTLEAVLERYGRRTRLLVELKARDAPGGAHDLLLARAATTLIRRLRLTGRTMVLCFDPLVLDECRRTDSRISTVLNLKPSRLNRKLRDRLADLDALSTNAKTLTPAFGRAVVATGTPLFVYTCNTRRTVDLALAAGARGLMSDRPGWLRGILAERGARR